jgi:MFS family permease
MIYLVGAWFPASYRGRTLALLSAIGPFTAVFGGPLSGLILNLEAWGLKGWQWMFILEGGPTIIFGFFMYYLMRNGIDDAEWLEPGEKQWLRDRLARESVSPANEDGAFKLRYLLDPRILTLGLTFFGSASVGFSVMFFLPQITKEFGLGDLDALLLAALPPASGVIAMLLWGRHSDKTGERIKHGLAALAVSAIGGFVTSMSSDPTIRITGLCVMLAGAYAFLPCFWSIPSTIFSGATAAAAIAMIQSVGNISGFVGPSIMGAVKQHTGNFNLGLQIASIFAVMGMVALLASMQVVERHARRTAEAPSAA